MKFIKWKHVGVLVFFVWATYVTVMLPLPMKNADASTFTLNATSPGGVDLNSDVNADEQLGAVTSPNAKNNDCSQYYDATNQDGSSGCNMSGLSNKQKYMGMGYSATCPAGQVAIGVEQGPFWGKSNAVNVIVPICTTLLIRE